MSVEYKLFYQFEGIKVWKSYEFEAANDIAAVSYAGQRIKDIESKRHYEPIARWGLQKITTERLI